MIFSYLVLVISLVSINTAHAMDETTPNGDESTGVLGIIQRFANRITGPSISKEQVCQGIENALKSNQRNQVMELIMRNGSLLEEQESQTYGLRILESLTEVELKSNNGALTSIFGDNNQYWKKDDLKYFLLQALLQLKSQQTEIDGLKAKIVASNTLVQELMTKQEFNIIEAEKPKLQSHNIGDTKSSPAQNDSHAQLLKSYLLNENYAPVPQSTPEAPKN